MNRPEGGADQLLRALIDCQQRISEIEKLQGEEKETLRHAQSLFEDLFELSPDALIVVDPKGRITRMNTEAERLFGYAREELIGKDHGILVPDRHRDKHDAELKVFVRQPLVRVMGIGLELYGRKKSGAEFPADIDLGPLRIGDEALVLAVVRDVTPRKQLEDDLIRSERRYRELVELSPDAVLIGSEGKIVFLNTAGAKLFGVGSPEKLIGKPVLELVHPDYRQIVRDRIRQVTEGGNVVPLIEEKFLKADGSVIYVDAISMPYTYEDRPAVLSIVRDITERKRAEMAKRETEERYRRTLDSMLEGCQIIGYDWTYLYLNDVAAVHARRPKEELLGHTMMEMYPGIEKTDVFARLRECMEKRVSVRMENEFTYPDGSKGWFELRIQPAPEGFFVLSMDISDRKKLEEEMGRYRQRLEEAVLGRTADLAKANSRLTDEIQERRKADEGLLLRATILDNAAEAVFLVNAGGDFVYANEAACKTYGYGHAEFLGMNIRKLLPPKDVSVIEARLKAVLEQHRLDVEAVHLRNDGTPMPVRVRHTLVKTLHGQFIVSVAREIEAESKMRLLLEQMPCIVWTTDSGLRLTSSMGAALTTLGLQPGQGTGMPMAEYLEQHGFEQTALAAHKRALAGTAVSYKFKNTKTGKTYSGWAAPYRDLLGEPAGAIGVILEATGRRSNTK
ncbi:MAG: PAS domain S-box protein [Dehalococcoidia bacterium]|nr:PAS domain S-box protein [Dehalococcoidia bacterium]